MKPIQSIPESVGSEKQGTNQPNWETRKELLRRLFKHFVALEEESAAVNREKAAVFSSAKAEGLAPKAVRAAFRQALREKANPEATAAQDALTATYLAALQENTVSIPSGPEFVGEDTPHSFARPRTYVRAKDAVRTLHVQKAAVDPRPPIDCQDAPSSIPESAEIELETALLREEMEVPNYPARAATNEAASLELHFEPELPRCPAAPEVSSTRAHTRESENACAAPNTHHNPAQSARNGQSDTSAAVSPELDLEPAIPGLTAASEASHKRESLGMATRGGEAVGADPHSVPRQSDGQSTRSASASLALEDEPEIPACLYWRNRPSN